MSYTINYSEKTARVVYTGETTVDEIRSAHFDLSGDERFYDCKNLILDVSNCNLEAVSVPNLITVIATDLGASKTLPSLKVAFLVKSYVNMEKTSEYINSSRNSPWQFRLFENEEHASEWLD